MKKSSENKKKNVKKAAKATQSKKRTEEKKQPKKKQTTSVSKEYDKEIKELQQQLEQERKKTEASSIQLEESAQKYHKLAKKNNRKNIYLLLMMLITCICAAGAIFVFYKRTRIIIYKDVTSVKNEVIDHFHQTEEKVENVHNATSKLDLLDAYGGNQPTHPKVLNFEEKWHGYKYWMVYSPYPHSDDKKENPHIVASNDLKNWEVPEGLKNPLDNTDYDYKNEVTYLSDPHLVYNNDKDILECYYRKVDDRHDAMILYRMTSSDGVHWSEREEILRTQRSKYDYISPAIIYDNGIYKVWFVNKGNVVCYAESTDGYHYSDCKTIPLKYPIGVKTWHLDVIKTEKGYEMITVAYISWNDRARMNIYYFQSPDETSFKSQGIIILKPSLISWDNQGMYRSTFLYENGTYYLIYSGISTTYERGLGLSYGENIENLIGSTLSDKE